MAFNYAMHHDIGEWIKPVSGGTLPADSDTPPESDSVEVLDVTSARVVILGEAGSDFHVKVEHSEDDSDWDVYERLGNTYEGTGVSGTGSTVEFKQDDVSTDDTNTGVTYFNVRLDGAKRYVRLAVEDDGGLDGNEIVWLLGNDGNVPSGYADKYDASAAYPDADR